MLNIFSFHGDKTCDQVIEYIKYFQREEKVKRIPAEAFSKVNINITDELDYVEIEGSKNKILLENRSSWIRRGIFSFKLPNLKNEYPKNVYKHLKKENDLLREFVYGYSLKLGDYFKEVFNNRITNMMIAKECGFSVPATIITTNKKDLISFFDKYESVITKPIHNGHLSYELDGKNFQSTGTIIYNKENLNNIPDFFAASLFQEYIVKELELRIFYINEKIFPMAIFSQLDDKTRFDYRNYNKTKPNRAVKFELPKEMKEKVHLFMDKTKMKTGSIDVILTPENKFIFLEINPTGQFGWVSKECNYYLEKEVAKNLCDYET